MANYKRPNPYKSAVLNLKIHKTEAGSGAAAPAKISWFGYIIGTFLVHVWFICGTFVDHFLNMFGTFVDHVWNICGPSLDQVWTTSGPFFDNLLA